MDITLPRAGRMAGRLAGRMTGRLAGRMAGRLMKSPESPRM